MFRHHTWATLVWGVVVVCCPHLFFFFFPHYGLHSGLDEGVPDKLLVLLLRNGGAYEFSIVHPATQTTRACAKSVALFLFSFC